MYVYIFTFQPSVRKISENNGSFRLGKILYLGLIKRKLKYIPGNIQDPIKNIYIENQNFISYKLVNRTLLFSFSSDQILKLILRS